MLAFSGWASADPPSRIARLGYTYGPVGFSPAGERDRAHASLNTPLTASGLSRARGPRSRRAAQ